jgi:histidinol dehydrogenase
MINQTDMYLTAEGKVAVADIMEQLWHGEDAQDILVANSPEFMNKPSGKSDQWRRED